MAAPITIRVRSRDGMERVELPHSYATVGDLQSAIELHLGVPALHQTLSADQNLLLAKTSQQLLRFSDMRDRAAFLLTIGISHGSVVFLFYPGERSVAAGPRAAAAGFGPRIVTIADFAAGRPGAGVVALRYTIEPRLPENQELGFLPVLQEPMVPAMAAVESSDRKRGRDSEGPFAAAKRMKSDEHWFRDSYFM